MAIGTFLLAHLCLTLLVRLSGLPQLQYAEPFWEQGYGTGVVILLIAVQPAIIEELAFRGIILGGLRRVLSAREAIIVSALIFMIIHLSVPSFPHLFVIGLALGYLRVRTGSLYPGMLLHFVHNLVCILAEVWMA